MGAIVGISTANNRYMTISSGMSASKLPAVQRYQNLQAASISGSKSLMLWGKDKPDMTKQKQKVETEALAELKKQKVFLEQLMGASIDPKVCNSMIASKTGYLKSKIADLDQMKKPPQQPPQKQKVVEDFKKTTQQVKMKK